MTDQGRDAEAMKDKTTDEWTALSDEALAALERRIVRHKDSAIAEINHYVIGDLLNALRELQSLRATARSASRDRGVEDAAKLVAGLRDDSRMEPMGFTEIAERILALLPADRSGTGAGEPVAYRHRWSNDETWGYSKSPRLIRGDDAEDFIQEPLYALSTPAPQPVAGEREQALAGELDAILNHTLNITDKELLRIRNDCERSPHSVQIWATMLQKIVDAVRDARRALKTPSPGEAT